MFLEINKMIEKEFNLEAETNNELITYSVCFKNKSDYSLHNVLLNIFIPNNTKLKKNSICINNISVEDKYVHGFKIKDLPSGNSINIKYTVEYIKKYDENENIYNKAKLKFYIGDQEFSIFSNETIINMEKSILVSEYEKVVLKEENDENEIVCDKGENITYSTKIKNFSKNYVDEIKILFEKIDGANFDAQYIKIRDEVKRIDINKDVYIEELAPEEEITLYFNMKISEKYENDKISIKGEIEYTYLNNLNIPTNGKLELREFTINLVAKEILNKKQSVDIQILNENKTVFRDEDIIHNIIVENLGPRELNESVLIIKNIDGLIINTREMTINNINIDSSNIKVKENKIFVHLGILQLNEKLNIQYWMSSKNFDRSIKVIESQVSIRGYCLYKGNEKGNLQEFKAILNEKVEDISVKVFLDSDKVEVIKNDDITYRSTIINDGTIPVDLTYYLEVSKGIKLNLNAISMNGIIYNDKNHSNKEIQCSLAPGDGVNIEHRYKYIRGCGRYRIKARGIVKCQYEGSKSLKKNVMKSEDIYINAAITTFKELDIEENINIFNTRPKINEVIKMNVEAELFDFYVIDIKRSTFEEFNVVGKKVRVRGNIKYIVEYLSKEDDEIVNLYYKEKLFSTSIKLPEDYIDGEINDIDIEVLDIYYKLIEKSNLFVNCKLMLNTNL
ncbi:MAG: hypothetical protein ACRDAU_11675 [Clostridium sp.]